MNSSIVIFQIVPQVAALEVQNVKRAINRYGTLPKGARIGAYLESLRREGEDGEGDVENEGGARAPAPPHMIRSNSSGGVRSFTRTTPKERPSLADLEFPPPPPEQPPSPLACSPLPPPPPPEEDLPPANYKMLELKLVTEIKESADRKGRHQHSPPPAAQHISIGDPVARLVSELSQSLNLECARVDNHKIVEERESSDVTPIPCLDSKFINKTELGNTSKIENTKNTYKSQLKKVEPQKKALGAKSERESTGSIVDFKSRLRKVDTSNGAVAKLDKDVEMLLFFSGKHDELFTSLCPEPKDILDTSDSKKSETEVNAALITKVEEDDDKRRSTGSISSLKKLWEPKEAESAPQPSPKLCNKNKKRMDEKNSEPPKADIVNKEQKSENGNISNIMSRSLNANNKSVERRQWVPGGEEKPVVPAKPAVKGGKPGSAIYAIPVGGGPEGIAELARGLESALRAGGPGHWARLAEGLGALGAACVAHCAEGAPPQRLFSLRALAPRLEDLQRGARALARPRPLAAAPDPILHAQDISAALKDAITTVAR